MSCYGKVIQVEEIHIMQKYGQVKAPSIYVCLLFHAKIWPG